MTINLTPEQETWLKAHVAAGDYGSVEDAARQLIDDKIAELSAESHGSDDIQWAVPYVKAAREDVARGDTLSLEDYRKRNTARLAALKD